MTAVSILQVVLFGFNLAGLQATREKDKHCDILQSCTTPEDKVRAMLNEQRSESSSISQQEHSESLQDWVPAVSLEAQQGKLPHQLLEREFRTQFQEVIGNEDMELFEKDLKSIMQDLSDTFTSFPKNEYGDVGHIAVRYALHRLFVARHGWYIRGLDPQSTGFSSSSPADVLRGQVPDQVQQVVEKLLYGRGFGLYETAVLAAVLENLIHKETAQKATKIFDILGISTSGWHDVEELDLALETYIAGYILGQDVILPSARVRDNFDSMMSKAYPGWEATRAWLRRIRATHGNVMFTFDESLSVFVDMGEQYGKWQQNECVAMKQKLVELESVKNGCVPVASFYKNMLLNESKWQFSEGPAYLRQIGALDESNPHDVKVMIPNYLTSASNCVASSSYYSVCCMNECEEILGRIERHVQAPDVLPEELASIISSLSSSSVPSNRTLPDSMLWHLRKIAAVHDGRVPLHSRLFMQWMHNAYPHECPYPPVPGSVKTPAIWSGMPSSKGELQSFLANASATTAANSTLAHPNSQCGQWLDSEELYVPWLRHPNLEEVETRETHAWAAATAVAFLGAAASALLMALHAYKSVLASARSKKLVNA